MLLESDGITDIVPTGFCLPPVSASFSFPMGSTLHFGPQSVPGLSLLSVEYEELVLIKHTVIMANLNIIEPITLFLFIGFTSKACK